MTRPNHVRTCSCPLHFAVIASSRDVRLDGVTETSGGRTVTRNSIALLMRRGQRDSAKNICSAVHVLLDGKVSPTRPDSGARPLCVVATSAVSLLLHAWLPVRRRCKASRAASLRFTAQAER